MVRAAGDWCNSWSILLGEISLRPAGPADMEMVFGWRNDPESRAMFLKSDVVQWSDHEAWFLGRLASEAPLYWIGLSGKNPIGTARLDAVGSETAEVSITVAPHCRGKGYGRRMLEEVVAQSVGDGFRVLLATIKRTNTASSRIFVHTGFTIERYSDEYLYMMRRDGGRKDAE